MTLPTESSDLFEQINFIDLQQEDAEKLVATYNEAGEDYKKKMEEKYGPQEKNRKRDSRYVTPLIKA